HSSAKAVISPARGEVWLVDLNPIRGHEQAGRRPALIVSIDAFNSGPADLVFGLPITSTTRGILYHVTVKPPEGGLEKTSEILCDAIRSISKERLIRRLGTITPPTMQAVEE